MSKLTLNHSNPYPKLRQLALLLTLLLALPQTAMGATEVVTKTITFNKTVTTVDSNISKSTMSVSVKEEVGGASTTYDTQSTCVVDLGQGRYMYMGDRWANPDKGYLLRDSRYVWLPIEFTSEGGIRIFKYNDWDLSIFDTLKP